MYSFSLVTPPAVEPVLLAEAKAQARIDTTADDALVTSLITGARQWAEKYTGRAFITQTWQMALDQLPTVADKGLDAASYLSLPRPPLQSVSAVQYFDNADAAYAWPAINYFVDTVREPGRLALRCGSVWPCASRLTNGIVITYVAGYGSNGAAVPEPIKTAIRQLVAHWYEHRGDVDTAASVPLVIQALLDPYRIRYAGI